MFLSLKAINENKTSGPYGFNSKFFTSCWNMVRDQFLKVARHFFLTFKMPNNSKHYLLILIPKIKNSCRVKDFRSISLCNTFYKVIAKC